MLRVGEATVYADSYLEHLLQLQIMQVVILMVTATATATIPGGDVYASALALALL